MKKTESVVPTSGEFVRYEGIWKRFWHLCKSARLPYASILLYVVLTALQGVILVRIPQASANFFAGDVSAQSVLTFIALELLSTVICQSILFINHVVRYKTNRNLRNVLWGKILKLKPAYFDKVSSSTLISRITVDSDSINELVFDVVLNGISQIYYMTLTVAAMSAISIKAGVYLLIFAPFSLLLSYVLGRFNLRFGNRAQFELSNLTEYLSELMSCMPLLKAFNMQGYERRRGKKAVDEYYKANRSLIGLDVVSQMVGSLFGILPEIAIILMGIKMLENSTLDAESWYIFYLYAGSFLSFFTLFGSIWKQAKSIQGKLNQVSSVLYEEEEGISAYTEELVSRGDIMFDQVSFSYGQEPLLTDVSFHLPGNGVTALVGYSGSGKTTILKLLSRIYEPSEGRILCGGSVIGEQDVRSWRKNLAYVLQDTPLMSGSIRDNLLYGIHREVPEEELTEVLSTVHLEGFIRELPEGLDTQVGQFGNRLSGGQRQKISIANAILTKAPILVLDEPTASLDITSTSEIIHAVEKLKGQRTVLLVTHDKQALAIADHVVSAEEDHRVLEGSAQQMRMLSDFCRQLMEKGGKADA